MATAPETPKEQPTFADAGAATIDEASLLSQRDRETGAQSARSGDADVNQNDRGRYGTLKQNLTTHWMVHER